MCGKDGGGEGDAKLHINNMHLCLMLMILATVGAKLSILTPTGATDEAPCGPLHQSLLQLLTNSGRYSLMRTHMGTRSTRFTHRHTHRHTRDTDRGLPVPQAGREPLGFF